MRSRTTEERMITAAKRNRHEKELNAIGHQRDQANEMIANLRAQIAGLNKQQDAIESQLAELKL